MKIIFLTQKLSGLTGGILYDTILYERLKSAIGDESVNLITDDIFDNEYNHENAHYKRFNKVYKKHADEILNCDYLIINSRCYTCFLSFPWKRNKKCHLILIHHHFNFMTQNNYFKYYIHKYLELSFLKRATAIITPNKYTMYMLKQEQIRERVILLEAYLNNTLKKYDVVKKNQIFFLGTVEPRKGVDIGIDVFYRFQKHVSGYKFIIAGTFDEKKTFCQKLLRKVREYNLENQVIFLGRVDDMEKERLYQESKVFLFPSQNEGYGWVMVEAMSYGLPVIAFDNTAMPYTVNNNNGALIPNRDIDKMVMALERILGDTQEYDRVSNGAKKTVLELPSEEEITKEYDIFMQQLKEFTI